jgi:hypothetical protein
MHWMKLIRGGEGGRVLNLFLERFVFTLNLTQSLAYEYGTHSSSHNIIMSPKKIKKKFIVNIAKNIY